MDARTVLFDFQIAEDGYKALSHGDRHTRDEITRVLAPFGIVEDQYLENGDGRFILRYQGTQLNSETFGRTAHFTGYPPNLVTLTFQYDRATTPQQTKNASVLDEGSMQLLKEELDNVLHPKKSKLYPEISRGAAVDRYVPTADRRLVEYDFDRTTFEADTEYQNVKIMHSPQYGNMLILDDDPNLAESDLAYTQAITGNGRECYEGKEVLILGGGDGGILHELRKENPKFITMVEIDQVVIDAAVQHLRGICYDSMDSLTGENYEVIVADCIPIMQKYIADGKQFDYIINDLTAIPITTEPRGSQWDFLHLILDLSMQILKPSGKYFTQGNAFNNKGALAMYEEQLQQLKYKVAFSKETVCVPSYLEMWVFYEIWKKSET